MSRTAEILICTVAGILALPFWGLACLIVFLTLGRPLFFAQMRAGQHGIPFRLCKLRTMSDACDASGNLLPDTERQTRATAILRRLRLDEIPQLFLILRGRMALVGPRPLLPETVKGFGRAGELRGMVRPGLTGWSQVSGNTTLSNEEKLHLDLWYVAHRSTPFDLQILWETLGVAAFGERRREDRLAMAAQWLSAERATSFMEGSK